jgi:hypothetical protein
MQLVIFNQFLKNFSFALTTNYTNTNFNQLLKSFSFALMTNYAISNFLTNF